jgi:hypothetical protein
MCKKLFLKFTLINVNLNYHCGSFLPPAQMTQALYAHMNNKKKNYHCGYRIGEFRCKILELLYKVPLDITGHEERPQKHRGGY